MKNMSGKKLRKKLPDPKKLYETNEGIPSDVLGSYTGKPLTDDDIPDQDADDL